VMFQAADSSSMRLIQVSFTGHSLRPSAAVALKVCSLY
jgi:hypothetical protein